MEPLVVSLNDVAHLLRVHHEALSGASFHELPPCVGGRIDDGVADAVATVSAFAQLVAAPREAKHRTKRRRRSTAEPRAASLVDGRVPVWVIDTMLDNLAVVQLDDQSNATGADNDTTDSTQGSGKAATGGYLSSHAALKRAQSLPSWTGERLDEGEDHTDLGLQFQWERPAQAKITVRHGGVGSGSAATPAQVWRVVHPSEVGARKNEEERRQLKEREAMHAEEWAQARAGWEGIQRSGGVATVKMFISSTFNDMHGERDVITRNIFPALNQRLLDSGRRVRAVPFDLRWGLTAEDTSDNGLGALEHCLIGTDACRPFFVLLLGERYGWRPPGYRVRDLPKWDWVRAFEPGHSITAMEIFHGFMRKTFTPMHAFMYERDPSFMDEIQSEDEKRIYAFDSDDPRILQRREDLKQVSVFPGCLGQGSFGTAAHCWRCFHRPSRNTRIASVESTRATTAAWTRKASHTSSTLQGSSV